jgi:glycosidase
MQWTSGVNAGFSSAAPWLPVNPDWHEVNVERESADPASLLSYYRSLLRLRRDESALRTGGFSVISGGTDGIFSYRREAVQAEGKDGTVRRIAVYLNFDGRSRNATIDRAGTVLQGSTHRSPRTEVAAGRLGLDPCEVLIVAEG